MLSIYGWGISFEIALSWLSQGFADDKSTLVQVMAWCRQATSHYLSQCWHSSLSPYGVTRPQWVKSIEFEGITIKQCCKESNSQNEIVYKIQQCYTYKLKYKAMWFFFHCFTGIIMVMLCKWWCISNNWQLNTMLNRFFRLTIEQTPKLSITGPLWGESTSDHCIPVHSSFETRLTNSTTRCCIWRHVRCNSCWQMKLFFLFLTQDMVDVDEIYNIA